MRYGKLFSFLNKARSSYILFCCFCKYEWNTAKATVVKDHGFRLGGSFSLADFLPGPQEALACESTQGAQLSVWAGWWPLVARPQWDILVWAGCWVQPRRCCLLGCWTVVSGRGPAAWGEKGRESGGAVFWVLRYSGCGHSGAHRGAREGWRRASGQAQPRLRLYTDIATTVANESPLGAVVPLSLWGSIRTVQAWQNGKENHISHRFQRHRKWNGGTVAVSSLLFKLVMRLTQLSLTKRAY